LRGVVSGVSREKEVMVERDEREQRQGKIAKVARARQE
jgi:hypothetical protein